MKTSGSSKKTTPPQDKNKTSGEESNEKPAWVQNCIGKVIPRRPKDVKWAQVVATTAKREVSIPTEGILRSLKVKKVNPAKLKITPSPTNTRVSMTEQKTEYKMMTPWYRATLDPWKLYLDSCATYHAFLRRSIWQDQKKARLL